MAGISLTEAPKIKASQVWLEEEGGTKFVLWVDTRAFVGSTPVDVRVIIEDLDTSTFPPVDWWTTEWPNKLQDAYTDAGYSIP